MASKLNVRFVVILSSVLIAVCIAVAATMILVLNTSPAENAAKAEQQRTEAVELLSQAMDAIRSSTEQAPGETPYLQSLKQGTLEPTTINLLRVADELERASIAQGGIDAAMSLQEQANALLLDAKKSISRAVNEAQGEVSYLEAWKSIMELTIPEDRAKLDKAFGEYMACLRDLARSARTDIEAHERYLDFRLAAMGGTSDRSAWESFTETVFDDTLAFFSPSGGFGAEPEPWHSLLRYSGLGFVRALAASQEWEPGVAQSAEEHLLAALRANPSDQRSLRWLLTLRELQLAGPLSGVDQAGPAREMAQGIRDRIAEFVRDNPDDPRGGLLAIEVEVSGPVRRALGDSGGIDDLQGLVSRIGQAVDGLIAQGAGRDPTADLSRVAGLEARLAGSLDRPQSRRLAEALALERPLDPMLRITQAQILREAGMIQRADALLELVASTPDLPVSLAAMSAPDLRIRALTMQSEVAFERWQDAASRGDEQAAALAAKDLTDIDRRLAERVPEGTPVRRISNVRVAMASEDVPGAQRILMDLVGEGSYRGADAYAMLYQIAQRSRNWSAVERYARLAQQRETDLRRRIIHSLNLAAALIQTERYEEAREIYRALARELPGNEQIADRLEAVEIAMGERSSGDPVLDTLRDAEQVAEGSSLQSGDIPGAIAMIEAATNQHGQDPRLDEALIRLHLANEDRAAARAVLDQAQRRFPDTQRFSRYAAVIETDDPIEARIAAIEQNADASELDRAIARAAVYSQAGRNELADRAIEEAAALDATHPRVIELRFRRAIRDRDRDAAESLAEQAGELNVDGVGGARFLAELAAVFGQPERAIAILRDAVATYPGQVEMLLQLSTIEAQQGQIDQAIGHIERAFEQRSSDVRIIETYARLLVRVGRYEDALSVLRQQDAQVASSQTLRDLLRDLESVSGNRDLAIEARERDYERDPDNLDNAIKLAQLYVESGRWAEARPIIDRLRESSDSLGLVTLDARWYSAQGRIDDARAVFTSYISQRSEQGDIGPDPYLALASLLNGANAQEQALETLRMARRWDDPESMRVEKAIGIQLANMQRPEQAIESFRRIVDGDADDDAGTYRKRLAAAYADAGQYDEAMAALEPLSSREDVDDRILLLRAGIERARGRPAQARELLSRALSLFPTSAEVYVQRARLTLQQAAERDDEQLFRDALADLDAAAELAPSNADVLRLRARVHLELDDLERAFADLREAALASPDNLQLVAGALNEYIRLGRDAEAATLAQNLIEQRGNDPDLLLICAGVFAGDEQWSRARRFARQAWEQVQNARTARSYSSTLLNATPQDPAEALRVIAAISADTVREDPELLLLRAEALHGRGQTGPAARDAQQAASLVASSPGSLLGWFGRIENIFEDRQTIVAVVQGLESQAQFGPWLDLLQANALSSDEGPLDEAKAIYDRLTALEEPAVLANAAYRAWSSRLMDRELYEQAVEVLQEGADRFQTDAQLANNLAFVLVDKLGRASEAIGYAEQAAQARPDDPNILDTLGWAQALGGQLDDAGQTLARARQLARGTPAEHAILLHLARVRLDQGRREEALRLIDEVRSALRAGQTLNEGYRALLGELTEQLRSPN